MDTLIRPLTIDCDGARMAAILHNAGGRANILMVSGGLQTRAGPHRLYTDLAAALAAHGFAVLRFDRRGVGDSDGADAGFDGSRADIIAAAATFGAAGRTIGFGLCDGAAALALFGADAGLADLILLNPWSVEAGTAPVVPAAAHRGRLLRRMASPAAWRHVLGGAVSLRAIWRSLVPHRQDVAGGPLADTLVNRINMFNGRVLVVLSGNDATAQHFSALLPRLGPRVVVARLPGADHTLTRPQDFAALLKHINNFVT